MGGWHDNYFGGDAYQWQSSDNGETYGPAIRVVGEDGTVVGWISPSQIFRRSATAPVTPATNTGNPPPGWADGPPDGADYIWQSSAQFRSGKQMTLWSSPQCISGKDGEDGLTGYFNTAFANSPTGLIDFTTGEPNGRAFIGVYSDFTPAESNDPSVYTWAPY